MFLSLFSGGGGGCYFIFSVDQKKQKPNQGYSLLLKQMETSNTVYLCVWTLPPHSCIVPVSCRPSLVHLACGLCFVFYFSFCKDIARKVNKGEVLRELKCGCYSDILCCE